jgi:hypothetical protein
MTYSWEFEVGGRPPTPLGRKCHRGPMIDIEIRMSQSCLTIPEAERIRQHLLQHVVDINNPAVQTREVVLRVLNSNLRAMFMGLIPVADALQVLICEKRNSLDIDNDVAYEDQFYKQVLGTFARYGTRPQHVDLISDALKSNSAIMRVAARCAIVLMVAYIEASL